MLKKFNISTKKDDIYEITADVKQAVEESGVKEGICVVFTPHTTAAIVVTSRMDPDGFEDIEGEDISSPSIRYVGVNLKVEF